MKIRLTRTVGFLATHRYGKPEWSPERNQARFGAAAEEHSHQYTCTVTVSGRPDPETDMVMDLPLLDRILEVEITRRFHGRSLHREVAEFTEGRALPTCEALARDVFTRIEPRLPAGIALERVTVAEDETLSAECSRE